MPKIKLGINSLIQFRLQGFPAVFLYNLAIREIVIMSMSNLYESAEKTCTVGHQGHVGHQGQASVLFLMSLQHLN